MGWRILCAGGVEVHDVLAEHLSVLRPPHVQRLAKKLTACLEEAQRVYERT
jgi:thioesterase domain-containing protein